MAEVCAFKGILYNTDKIKDFSEVGAPPYDVISGEQQDILYNRSKYNVIRIILGKEKEGDTEEDSKYTRSAQCLNEWLNEGILKQDASPGIYSYNQEYTVKDKTYCRKGFIALAKVEEYEKKIILPHEHTLPKAKADRMKLLKRCKTNLSQIFCLYSDTKCTIDNLIENDKEKVSRVEVTDEDGVKHILSSVHSPALLNKISEEMKDKKLYIADGHHRYETALGYRNYRREEAGEASGKAPYDYQMMYFANMDSDGMTIFPTHRLIHNLENFDIEEIKNKISTQFDIENVSNCEELIEKMKVIGTAHHVFGLYSGDRAFYMLTLKDKDVMKSIGENKELNSLDVYILHELIFKQMLGIDKESVAKQKNVKYVSDDQDAVNKVDNDIYHAAFLLNPTKMESLKSIVEGGGKMPQKSTYFYPKLMSGLVFNKLTD